MSDDYGARISRLEQTVEAISTKLELILTQTRVLIQQGDHVMEFMNGLSDGLLEVQKAQASGGSDNLPAGVDEATLKGVEDALRALSPQEDEKDPRQPGWGYEAWRARQGDGNDDS